MLNVKFNLVLSFFALFLIASTLKCASASTGDSHPYYRTCLNNCINIDCNQNPSQNGMLPWYMRLLFWDCGSNCRYECQIDTEHYFAMNGVPSQQYFGKWYFIRVCGIQEFFSVLFSIFNLIVHYDGYQRMRRCIPASHHSKSLCLKWALIGMNAWIWSSVFHIRDTPITEKLDYFSAGAFVLFGLYNSLVLMFKLDLKQGGKPITFLLATLFSLAFLSHISYLSFYTFDYDYNMKANLSIGLLSNFAWFYYSWKHRNSGLHWTKWPALSVTALMLSASLELFDFSPIANLIDAHSLWHLATVPITYYIYSFVIKSSVYDTIAGSPKLKSMYGRD
ncbi:GPI-phospholipase A2 activity regulator [Schizosaccharomyces cryophilus OY26]|uniref:Post-GPI attachment to proteins factor 3 n=1 Tax=Schizosaccharomyces cryophilus (strain OY26 / ATCC MYA-4695 / CBS 11777 / NBRC 106824 / NRRL Y48691) TaxID=653667 RepID=S9W238_SCHCR|nr:GPI-phospholipase A2 activity regulator [Schizosaccharomyces cryophilus OY26]EPY52414.1 GPI-phospholipase A2 activity regulator [Schizosaccharomyces cryophilus OY26]